MNDPATIIRTPVASPKPSTGVSTAARSAAFWSATPTPMDAAGAIDVGAVHRMIDWHAAHRFAGVMVLGTCGEGPWLPDRERQILIREAARAAGGRLAIAAQVTDNSVGRVLEQIDLAAAAGATHAFVAQPYFALRVKLPDFVRFYGEIAERSALPVGFYDRGKSAAVPVPTDVIAAIVGHPRIGFVKDSSSDSERAAIYLAARDARPDLTVMTGNEFKCIESLERGYDGFMLGGAIVNASYVRRMLAAWTAGDRKRAAAVDAEMQDMLRTVYGGASIACWLAGLKYVLVRLGLFSTTRNLLGYELSDSCREGIDRLLESNPQRFHPANPA